MVQQLGGSIEKQAETKNKAIKSEDESKRKEKTDHTRLFGKWKEHGTDPKRLREEAW